ncbi:MULTISPECIES: DUF3077 domain-containing protein [unclassified Pseudomonas]|jgi:hypothetical protein|uniref:DUF3077 domain-containing protein n=1 Tax=unclassified Pseudomonas TaxID=196821 RepID=UPI0008E6EFD5|nr:MULTISPECIES: DUF3077 domain-containing protein [unclassified Pseudomonas]SFI62226.1 Protein of unknown function [Pseudomonas sp. NFPP04]SFJ72861.1 Protein of unknown function [Pseudomonas sp. NFPP11]
MSKVVPDPPLSAITTLGVVTFGDYGENEKPLFRVNSGMPIEEALEHASTLLFYSKKLATGLSTAENIPVRPSVVITHCFFQLIRVFVNLING